MKNSKTQIVPVLGMGCVGCASNVERALQKLPGIESASINFASNNLTVTYHPTEINLSEMQSAVQAAGYDLIVEEENPLEAKEEAERKRYARIKRDTIGAWALAIPLVLLAMVFMHLPYVNWVEMVLALAIMIFFGRTFYINGFRHALRGNSNMDTLVALSTSITFLFSLFNTAYPEFWTSKGLEAHVYYEAAGVIIAFILIGKLLEEKAKHSTSSAIRSLISLQPKTARKVTDGVENEVEISTLITGDIISIHPGEKIPVDGIVLSGSSSVDKSLLSGEAFPVLTLPGNKVMAGTINQKGSFTMEVTGVGQVTVLGQIVRMVQEAQGSKAPVQQMVDKISWVFVPVVVGLAALTFILWLVIGGTSYFSYALLSAVSVLVIACPCALGLATPTALMVGMGKAAEQHILIKDAYALENMCKVDAVVLDKTGTLTQGKPQVVDSYWMSEANVAYLDYLYTAESMSEHPMAAAILEWMEDSGASVIKPESFESITGYGVRLEMGGLNYWVGNQGLLERFEATIPEEVERRLERWKKNGYSVTYYGVESVLLAVMAVADRIKPTSLQAVDSLKNVNLDIHLLSGDSEESAQSVATALGIHHCKGDVLPQDKENYIKALQSMGKVVAMVGDGINDSQALARADVSIAMGEGTDIAMDVAQVTLITSDLSLLTKAIYISKRTVRLIGENLFWAFIFNLIGIPLAAGILYPVNSMLLNPMMASAAMAFSSVAVVANSLRLKLIR
jgi:Cu2+-exporting ATPase